MAHRPIAAVFLAVAGSFGLAVACVSTFGSDKETGNHAVARSFSHGLTPPEPQPPEKSIPKTLGRFAGRAIVIAVDSTGEFLGAAADEVENRSSGASTPKSRERRDD